MTNPGPAGREPATADRVRRDPSASIPTPLIGRASLLESLDRPTRWSPPGTPHRLEALIGEPNGDGTLSIRHYFAGQQRPDNPWLRGDVISSGALGPAALTQRGRPGTRGHELVGYLPEPDGLVEYAWAVNDSALLRWRRIGVVEVWNASEVAGDRPIWDGPEGPDEWGAGTVVATESYNAGDTTFDAQISSIVAQSPDAIALITFEEIKTIIPALEAGGVDMSQLYFVDGNIADYSEDFDPGTLEGSKGTQPGPALDDSFLEGLNAVWTEHSGEELSDLNYAGETYDAIVLAALSALAANSVEGPDMATWMGQVSGGSGDGEKFTTFADAAAAIIEGKIVDYDGPSGPITFNAAGDPTEATIGIFQYDENNSLVRQN